MLYLFLRRILVGPIVNAGLPPLGQGSGEHPGRRSGAAGQQPPGVLRLGVPAGRGAAADPSSRRRRSTSPRPGSRAGGGGVLPCHRPGPDRPLRRPGLDGRARRPGSGSCPKGKLFGIYPEGTRSPDGRLYKGRTGVARIAIVAGVPVIPVAMIDTDKLQPPGRAWPQLAGPRTRPPAAAAGAPRRGDRQAAGLQPVRGHGARPARAALGHRRDHVRADGPVRPGVRRHVRAPRPRSSSSAARSRRTTSYRGTRTPEPPDQRRAGRPVGCHFSVNAPSTTRFSPVTAAAVARYRKAAAISSGWIQRLISVPAMNCSLTSSGTAS